MNLIFLSLDYHSTEEDKIETIIRFFRKNPEIDAVLFLANYIGLAGLQAFRKMGLKIPEDLAIISFDDHYSFRLHTPSIAVIEQPIDTIAIKAVGLLMDQMMGDGDFDIEKVLQKGKLLIRESV